MRCSMCRATTSYRGVRRSRVSCSAIERTASATPTSLIDSLVSGREFRREDSAVLQEITQLWTMPALHVYIMYHSCSLCTEAARGRAPAFVSESFALCIPG